MQGKEDLLKRTQELSALKRAFLQKRMHQDVTDQTISATLSRRPAGTRAPLSFAQQRLWSSQQSDPQCTVYNELFAMHVTGWLDVTVFTQALGAIAQRHEILRTTFLSSDGGQVSQIVAPSVDWSAILALVNMWNVPETEHDAVLQRIALDEAHQPFDLSRGPLWKVILLQMSETEHALLLVMHHIITDGWSMGIFVHELADLYTAFKGKQPSPLPALALQYGDYAYWQRQRLQEGALAGDLAYWRGQLGGGPLPVLEFSGHRSQSIDRTYRGRRRRLTIAPSLSQDLHALSHQEGVSLFMILLAAFEIVLYHLTTQEDLVVTVPVAGRTHTELESLLGLFANTLVFRTNVTENSSFREFLQQVRKTALEAYEHQEMPFEHLVAELQPLQSDLGLTPFFQIMFIMQNVPASAEHASGLTFRPVELDNDTARFDLMFSMEETRQRLHGFLEYRSDLFEISTIDRLLDHFQRVLEQSIHDPSQRIMEIGLV